MIFITAEFTVRPESADRWPEIAADFTAATRAEPGCLWFDWSRSVEAPGKYVLVEAFRDESAGAAHVQPAYFRAAQQTLPPHLLETPRVVNTSLPQDDWSRLGEMAVPERQEQAVRPGAGRPARRQVRVSVGRPPRRRVATPDRPARGRAGG